MSGLIGDAMNRLGFPMAPLVLGLVIGALFEKALVQTSSLTGGNMVEYVLGRPLALAILVLAALLVVAPSLVSWLLRRRRDPAAQVREDDTIRR